MILDLQEDILKQTRSENIYQKPEGWLIDYQEFAKLANEQMHTFWPWDEPLVENDRQDLLVNCSKAEKHGIIEVLKLFTKYEDAAGGNYWSDRVMKVFKRPEIRRMASLFSGVEYNSHAPFYNRINEVLFIDTPEFYSSWMDYDYLKERMEFIEEIVSNKDDLISTGGFTFVEGAILYSSFSYLKHFQVQSCGKNLITNICRGIDLTVADENTHAVGSALLFNTIKKERKLNEQQNSYLESVMKDIGLKAYEHESHIINNIFSQGEIGGISIRNMKDFVKHRINLCLNMLGYDDIFPNEELDGSIASWFYANINSTNFHDFFTGSGSSYHIEWKKDLFGNVWG